MHVRVLGQILFFFAIALIVWNLLISEFGRWRVLAWFDGITPVDVMFFIAVAMVALLVVGDRRQPPAGGSSAGPKTYW